MWDKRVPRHLRQDRDVVLARLRRADLFAGARSTKRLTIPQNLRTDLEVVLATVRRYPDVLFPDTATTSAGSSSSVLQKKPQQKPHKKKEEPSLLDLHPDSHVAIFQAVLDAFQCLDPLEHPWSSVDAVVSTLQAHEFLDLLSKSHVHGDRQVMLRFWVELQRWNLGLVVHKVFAESCALSDLFSEREDGRFEGSTTLVVDLEA